MRRAVSRLSGETFDVLVLGGGITGACIARDASKRGLSVALIERRDFAGATSANNSKLIHGGLRYLRNLELRLVRESLGARRIWQRIAPHLVHPLPFLVPLLHDGLFERAKLEAGLTLYDALSYDRARLDDPYQRLPGHSWLGRNEAIAQESVLGTEGLQGAFLYYDAQMYSPERLALECLIDADQEGAAVANYVEAQALLVHYGAVAGCSAQDGISGDTFDIRARQTIVAAGPWTDLFLEKALHKPPACKLKRSKGIHIVVPSRTARHALTVAAADTHFFVLPWRGHTILGTTDTAFTGDPDAAGVREPDIAQFFDFMNRHLPTMALRRSEVEHFYAGLRPLVDDGSKDTYGASRRAEIVDHVQTDNLAGLVSVIGGKWTTSRELAEQVTDRILPKLGKSHRPCTTAAARMPGGEIDDFLAFERSVAQEYPELQNIGHLVRQYGRALPAVLRQGAERPGLLQPIATTGDIGAQVIHAVQEEMAQTLEDVILRRTGIGQLGAPSPAELETVSRLMAQQLDWNEARRQAEIEASRGVYRTADGPG